MTANESTIADDSEVQELHKQLHKLQKENKELREKLESIPTQDALPITRLEAVKSKVLNKMKVGRQSSVGKALSAFIKELRS